MKASLVRGLTLIPATALIVTQVIGTGVFVKARVMTCNVGTPWMVLLAYLVAGILTLGGALTFAELSAMMPRSGGQYNFIGAAFGRVWAFLFSNGSWAHFAANGATGACEGVSPGTQLGATGFGAAVIGALWSYNGWATGCFVAEEIRESERTLPRALVGGSVLIIGLYLLVNAGYFYALSPLTVSNLPEASSVAGAVMVRMLGAGGASLLTLGMMLSTFGSLHSVCVTVARVPFAMARDGLLPATFAKISTRSRVPTNAVLLVGACAVGFAFSGTFDLLTDLIVFMLLLFNGLAVAAVYVLRRKLPNAVRPYRVWGYPLVPALFLIATVYLMINTLIATPGRALAGLGIVGLALPLYAFYARRLPPSRPEDWLVARETVPLHESTQ